MKYIITAQAEFIDDNPNPDVMIDNRLADLKAGKVRLIDYMEDCQISISPVHPTAPSDVQYLNCKHHGEQPFALHFAPDVYRCPITNCAMTYEWAEVWGDQYNVGG